MSPSPLSSEANSDDPDFKIPEIPVSEDDLPKRKFLSKEERKAKLKPKYEAKDSSRKVASIVEHFRKYREECGDTRELTEVAADEISEMLASFWAERKKLDGKVHDVPTLHSEMSRLAAHIHRETGFNPTTHPDFDAYRQTKEQKLIQSKQEEGNGELRHQSDALDPEEISHFFDVGLINTGSGVGIIRMIFTTFMNVLNSRAIKSHLILKLGNIKVSISRNLEFLH